MGRIAARGVGRSTPVGLRIRVSRLAVAPGAVERNALAKKWGKGLHDGQHRVIFTGSDVLIEQMEKYGAEVPFATIKKIYRYYTLS